MKSSVLTFGVLAVVGLATALAGTKTSSTIHPATLARIEAITSYCEKANPKWESQYREKLAALRYDHSGDELERAREKSKYRNAMEQATETLSMATQITGRRACAEFAAGK
jgi:hypothetical protein